MDRASNGTDPRQNPECIDVCAKDRSSGQFCGVKALFPILGAAFVAGELAGRPCSTINLSTLKVSGEVWNQSDAYQQCIEPSR
jgi:hypothetical protein